MRFEDLRLQDKLLNAIADAGFTTPTPIQQHAIPLLLQGSDLIGQAQTGTGKTAAFALSILQVLPPEKKVQALVLVPTRELALQVVEEFRELGKYCPHLVLPVYGGEDIERQIGALHRGVDVIVGTPGRVIDHLERGTLNLGHVKMVVLDEADRMLDMGFIDDVRFILSKAPKHRQTMLFSATMPHAIVQLAKESMVQPELVKTSEDKMTAENITQHFVVVDPKQKTSTLCSLLAKRKPYLTIVFCRTKRGADSLHYALKDKGFDNVCLHGDLTQARREKNIASFREQKANILVATDVAARGLDIDDVELIVNYNLPDEPEVYVHRIGRTARAGKEGDAISFVTNVMEKRELEKMVARSRSTIERLDVVVDPKYNVFTPRRHRPDEELAPHARGRRERFGGRHFGSGPQGSHFSRRRGPQFHGRDRRRPLPGRSRSRA